MTGDGKADAIVVNDDTITVRPSTGNGFEPPKDWTRGPFFGTRGIFFADVTGDGKADAIVVNEDNVTVRPSDGAQFLPNETWTTGPYFGDRGIYFADVTGGGKADAIVVNENNVIVRPSDGTKFLANVPWTNEPYYASLTVVPKPPDFYRRYFFEQGASGLRDYFWDVTDRRIRLVGDVYGWFDIGHTLPEHTAVAWATQRQQAYQWGLDTARTNGVPIQSYRRRVIIVNEPSDHGAMGVGAASMLIAHQFPGALWNHSFMQHEFGHVLGLDESWSTQPDQVYGDDYCVMSIFTTPYEFTTTILGERAIAGPGLNGVYADQLGSLEPYRVEQLPATASCHCALNTARVCRTGWDFRCEDSA